MNTPSVSLKVIVVVHFVLTVWATLQPAYLPGAYTYMNTITILVGAFCIMSPDSVDGIAVFLVLHVISIINDIIMIAIYQPIANDIFERPDSSATQVMRNTYRFSLGMSIVNLIIKPLTAFVLFRIYQERGGDSGDWIPGLPNFKHMPGAYENIDQPVPSNTVETASPHHTIETPPHDQTYGKGEQ